MRLPLTFFVQLNVRPLFYQIKALVPQGSGLRPVLHTLYSDLLITDDTTITNIVNKIALMVSSTSQAEATEKFQTALDLLSA